MNVKQNERDHLKTIFSLIHASNVNENEFLNKLEDIFSEKVKDKEFYFSVFKELAKSILDDNISNFKKLSHLIDHMLLVGDLDFIKECYKSELNYFIDTNIVILACKFYRKTILEYMFNPSSTIFNNMSKLKTICPNDEDGNSHNVFYYAIKSDNTELLSELMDNFLRNSMHIDKKVLDNALSSSYEELKLKNIPLSHQTKIYVQRRLIELRFHPDFVNCKLSHKKKFNARKERIELVLQYIKIIEEKHGDSMQISQQFTFLLECIAKSIHILKREMKYTYEILPWEEIEFCLNNYIINCLENNSNLFTSLILNKKKIISYLTYFSKDLDEIKNKMTLNFKNMYCSMNNREEVISNILKRSPEFASLYDDYNQLRDLCSLEKINYFVKLVSSCDSLTNADQLIILRSIQGIGEHLKNTLETPKMSATLSNLIIDSIPKNTRSIVIKLRNSLSHSASVFQRMEIKRDLDKKSFICIQNDIILIGVEITSILYKRKINFIQLLLDEIIKSENLTGEMSILETLKNISFNEDFFDDSFNAHINSLKSSFEELYNLLNSCAIKIKHELDVNALLENELYIHKNIMAGIKGLLDYSYLDNDILRGIKFFAKTFRSKISNLEIDPSAKIIDFINEVHQQVLYLSYSEDFDKILCLINRIYLGFNGTCIKIEDLSNLLKSNHFSPATEKPTQESETKCSWLLKEKILELKEIVKNYNLDFAYIPITYKSNYKLHAMIDMVLLDIISLLSVFNNVLVDNHLFLDQHFPLIIGKSLRNHIAHDNSIVSILCPDSEILILLNALFFINYNVVQRKKRIGQSVVPDLQNLQRIHNRSLLIINNQHEMFAALEEGNFEKLNLAIEKGADLESRNVYLWTSFHFAANAPSEKMLDFLLKKDLKINLSDINGHTPLHIAVINIKKHNVTFLIKEGSCDINGKDKFGRTPLHLAAQKGDKDIVMILLQHNAAIDILDSSGIPPLHYAIKHNHKDIVKLFYKKSRMIDIESFGGYKSLHIAAERGHFEIVNFLIDNGSNVNSTTDKLWCPLHAASLNGHLETIKILIANGADVNAKLLDGCTPLHYAVENGHEAVTSLLIANGANVNSYDFHFNNTPLHYAAGDGHEGIIYLLLRNNANINSVTVKGQTPLHFAAKCFNPNVFLTLLKHGANFNIKDDNKMTPFHVAVAEGNIKVIEILIQHGFSVNTKSSNNLSPLHIAALAGKSEVIKFLLENNAILNVNPDIEGNTPLHSSIIGGNHEAVEILLKKGINVNAKNLLGLTALHLAVASGCEDLVSLLLNKDHPVAINAKCIKGLTPLSLAVFYKKLDIVKLLINKKAEVNSQTSPLSLAALKGYKDIAKVLIDNGALIDGNGIASPLLISVYHNHIETVKLLLINGAKVNGTSDIFGVIQSLPRPDQGALLNKRTSFMQMISLNQPQIKNDSELLSLFNSNAGNELLHDPISVRPFLPLKIKDNVSQKSSRNKNELNSHLGSYLRSNKISPLSLAAYLGYERILELLLKYKADINLLSFGYSPLHLAAYRGHKKIVETLITKISQIDVTSFLCPMTPLCLAARAGHNEIVECLVANGADVNFLSSDGTPLHFAAAKGHSQVVNILLNNKAKINAKDHKDRLPIELAVAHNRINVVQMLLKSQKENINEISNSNPNWSLLHIACQEENLEMVKYLVNEGCNINAKNMMGSKPIHLAARDGFVDTVDFLLSKGCSVNDSGCHDQTPLHYAVTNGSFKMVKYLISKGANVNSQDSFGASTPLHFAARGGNVKIVELLLNNGAFFNSLTKMKQSPINLAVNKNIHDLLFFTEKLFTFVKHNDIMEVKNAVNSGAVVNAKNIDSKTPLHYAAWKGYSEICDILLKNHACPNACDTKGFTPLHFSAKFAKKQSVISLLSYGAIYNKASSSGKCPCDLNEDKFLDSLFDLIKSSFKEVKEGSSSFIKKLNILKDVSLVKAVMNACNRNNQTLIVLGILNNFPFINELKDVLQDDVPSILKKASLCMINGSYNEAIELYRNIQDKRKSILGPHNPGTLEIKLLIAQGLYKQGAYDEACNLLEEVIEKQSEVLGLNHEITLKSRSFYALILHRKNCDEEALEIFQEVYQKQKNILGATHEDSVDTNFHMALVMNKLGDCDKAFKINMEIFQIRQKKLGSQHPLTLSAQNNIAMVLACQNKKEEALKTYQDVLENKKKWYGINNQETLRTLCSIGRTLVGLKRYGEAIQIFNETLSYQEKCLGMNHPETLNTQLALSDVLLLQGKLISALKGFRNCIHSVKSIFGENSEIYLATKTKIDTIYKILNFQEMSEADINKYFQQNIISAVINNDMRGIHILLKEGTDINVKNIDGVTALHYAANSRNIAVTKLLLNYGADVTLVSNKGNTPLHIAASKGYADLVQIFLQHANEKDLDKLINARTINTGSTALHVASSNGFFEIVKLLLKYGANFRIENKAMQSARCLSKDTNIIRFFQLIEEFHDDIKIGNISVISKLETLKSNDFLAVVNARDDLGNKLLNVAIKNGHITLSRELLTLLQKCKYAE